MKRSRKELNNMECIHNFEDNICKICGDVATNERACTHAEYNELCVTCLDIEAHAGYATKEGFANFDADSDWSDKVEYYNRPEPEPDEEEDYNHAERNAIEE